MIKSPAMLPSGERRCARQEGEEDCQLAAGDEKRSCSICCWASAIKTSQEEQSGPDAGVTRQRSERNVGRGEMEGGGEVLGQGSRENVSGYKY